MTWLILQILMYLGVAAIIGGFVGWLVRGLVAPPPEPAAAPSPSAEVPAGEDMDRARLLSERERILAERDRLAAERDRLAAERDGLARERDALGRERDGLARELEETRALAERLERIIESEHRR